MGSAAHRRAHFEASLQFRQFSVASRLRSLTPLFTRLECDWSVFSPRCRNRLMPGRQLVALPVYNEARHVDRVLDEVRRYSRDVLVVDDGSSDGTAQILRRRGDVRVVTHEQNRGYGAALLTA